MDAPKLQDVNLRRMTFGIGVAIGVFAVVLLLVIGFAGWWANRSAVERDKGLIENALNQAVARTLNEQKSVSWWDDAILNTAVTMNPDWAHENFGLFLTETYGHDEVFVFDNVNRLVFSFAEGEGFSKPRLDARTKQLAPLIEGIRSGAPSNLNGRVDLFGPSQKNYELLSDILTCARWRGGILSVDGEPAIVTAITICPNSDFALLNSKSFLLVSVVRIDAGFVAALARSLVLPDLSLTRGGSVPPKGLTIEPFVTDDGAQSGFLSWTPKRPGHVLLTVILPLIAAGVLGTGILASVMLRRLRTASTELARRGSAAVHQATHDALSGLPNRHFFAEKLRAALGRQGSPTARLTVAYIDIDRFKDTNDTLGHQAGDELIQAVSGRLTQGLSAGDVLARFGGDEFAIMRPHSRADEELDWVGALTASFVEPFPVTGQHLRITASIGLASAPDHGTTPEELMRTADIALYAAKKRGRDQAVFFSSEMAEDVHQHRKIELYLREAIGSDQMTLHYQPIISCKTNAVIGLEALLRWDHPTEGSIPPSVFIPIAEEIGMMPALGVWILDRAFADAARWPGLDVAVNLSPAQFHDVELAALLGSLCSRHGVEPGRIVLEITEGLLLESSPRVIATLEAIRGMRFKLALDDFGTGYSSLNYLHVFGFDELKIDRSFLHGISALNHAKTIIQSVISLGRSLGIQVIAEGVETQSEAAMMRLFGCSAMQGFLFSKAVPPDEVDLVVERIARSFSGADQAHATADAARRHA